LKPGAVNLEVFINGVIAIVILEVTRLDLWKLPLAGPLADTKLLAAAAPDALKVIEAEAPLFEAIIHDAIAVIVHSVADLS
jgi:hypothetical protein